MEKYIEQKCRLRLNFCNIASSFKININIFILDVTTETYQAGIQNLDQQIAQLQVQVDNTNRKIAANTAAIPENQQGKSNLRVASNLAPPKGRGEGTVVVVCLSVYLFSLHY